jgi:subtilase family serine protease
MRHRRVVLSTTTFGVVVALAVLALSTAPAGAARPVTPPGLANRPVCGPAAQGSARCDARVVVDASGAPLATTGPTSGFRPADLQAAYRLPSGTAGLGQTVAIVDAYDDPSAEADLGVYRAQFGLGSCTSATGCFTKVDQSGGTHYPSANAGWAQEISLDLDMVSATCPNCKILLVEASSASYADLGAAVDRAASTAGVTAISNSYGGAEFSQETGSNYGGHYNHPGIAVTASSGDAGYGVEFPAASQYVTAVGGTSLARATSARGFTETAWSGAGSGCSAYVPKPTWQTNTGCSHRTVADVAAVADPATGVAVYDSYAYQRRSGWLVFGGTSVASPIVASVYALAGNAATVANAASLYGATGSLFDVVAGSNGRCKGSYLCTAGPLYDGPTGLGTPNGTGAF